MEVEVDPYLCTKSLKDGDRLLLCTDGLTGELDDGEICSILQKYKNPQAACQSLLGAANSAGGHDNITVVVVDWLE
jgi:protein phosphatase